MLGLRASAKAPRLGRALTGGGRVPSRSGLALGEMGAGAVGVSSCLDEPDGEAEAEAEAEWLR